MWLINSHNGIKEKGIKPIDINNYPAIKNHLNRYSSQLKKRADKGSTFYNLRNCAYMEDFYKQKLIWIELADKGRFAIDDSDNFMTLNGTYILTGDNLEYLCCILNNPVISWEFNTFCISSGVGTNQWRELYVRNLLIPVIPRDSQKLFFQLLHDIANLEKENKSSAILQKEINQMVYASLKLNCEEINFIESQ